MVSILDAAFTIMIINKTYDHDSELAIATFESNPVPSKVLEYSGILGLVWYKIILVTIITLCLIPAYKKYPKFSAWVWIISVIITATVVFYSAIALFNLPEVGRKYV